MTPNSHLHDAFAHDRELAIRHHAARPRLAARRRGFPAEAAAGATMLVGIAALIALGAPLGA